MGVCFYMMGNYFSFYCFSLRSTFQVRVTLTTVSKDAFLIRTWVIMLVISRSFIGDTIELAVSNPRETLTYYEVI